MAGSYILMSSEKAKKLALECKARVDTARQEAVKQLVSQERQRWARVRKALRRPDPTDDEILKSLKYSWVYESIRFTYFHNEDASKRILLATEIAETVQVSTEDLELLLGR